MKITKTQVDVRYTISDLTQRELDLISHLLGRVTGFTTWDEESWDSYDLYDAIEDHASHAHVTAKVCS